MTKFLKKQKKPILWSILPKGNFVIKILAKYNCSGLKHLDVKDAE